MKFAVSSILTAFDSQTIGSKVTDEEAFTGVLEKAVKIHDKTKDRAPGQHFVMLPDVACKMVSAGVGTRTDNPDDYVLRTHRGKVSAFLQREKAAEVEGVAVVVYTREAYLADPDTIADGNEFRFINETDCTHVIVAVLAFAGPQAPLTPYRLVHNLSGGNNEIYDWCMEDVVEKAKESLAYHDKYAVVAD